MSNSKTLVPLNIFSCSWTFWKACNEISNFHVEHFSWIKLDLGDKWPWSWQKKCWKTLRNFSKCLEKIQILTFCWLFWYFWFLMIKLNNLKYLDDEKFWIPKLTKKVKVWLCLDNWLFVWWFKISTISQPWYWRCLEPKN